MQDSSRVPGGVLVVRSTSSLYDGRVLRLHDELQFRGYAVTVLGWDREGDTTTDQDLEPHHFVVFGKKAGHGRGLANVTAVLLWMYFVIKVALRLRRRYQCIHACNLDSALPLLLVAFFLRKRFIYDQCDALADFIRGVPNTVKDVISGIEHFVAERADAVVLPAASRAWPALSAGGAALAIVDNSPRAEGVLGKRPSDHGFTILYIGILGRGRGIETAIEVVRHHPEWHLKIAGFGEMESTIRESACRIPNVSFVGRIKYRRTLELIAAADLVIATNDPALPVNRHSNPNRLFAAMMLGRPVVVSRGTGVDGLVECLNVGYVIRYGDIEQLTQTCAQIAAWSMEQRERFEEATRTTFQDRFGWKNNASQLDLIYRRDSTSPRQARRVAVISFQTKGAMGQYMAALAPELSKAIALEAFLPFHFSLRRADVEEFPMNCGDTPPTVAFRQLTLWGIPAVLRRIRRAHDVVHVLTGENYPWSLAIGLWARVWKIPFVVTVHDPEIHPSEAIQRCLSVYRWLTIKVASGVHVHSRLLASGSLAKLDPNTVFEIPHGSLAERFLKHRDPRIQRERFVLFFGRLERYKGLGVLVDAILELKPSFRCIIAGPGRLPKDVSEVVSRHPELFEVHSYYISDAQVAHLMQRAAVCVLPYTSASASSVPLIAGAFSTPLVGSAVGALAEDIPFVGGRLVTPGDSRALAAAISATVGTPTVYDGKRDFSVLARAFADMYERAERA